MAHPLQTSVGREGLDLIFLHLLIVKFSFFEVSVPKCSLDSFNT